MQIDIKLLWLTKQMDKTTILIFLLSEKANLLQHLLPMIYF